MDKDSIDDKDNCVTTCGTIAFVLRSSSLRNTDELRKPWKFLSYGPAYNKKPYRLSTRFTHRVLMVQLMDGEMLQCRN
jgi:hypothetical protein